MSELLFYHLERRPLESVLPELLQRSLERGWRVVVKVGSDERLEALNAHLWSYDEAAFLPHGAAADGHAESQPIFLTTGDDNPNGADWMKQGVSTALARVSPLGGSIDWTPDPSAKDRDLTSRLRPQYRAG